MHLPHFAKRPMAALAFSVILTACNSTEPDQPFNPSGMSTDVANIEAAFNSSVMDSYDEVIGYLSDMTGGTAASVAFPSTSVLSNRAASAAFAKRISARLAGSAVRPSFSLGEFAGKTFEYDEDTDTYGPTDRTGAPSNGIRFILYAVDSVTGQIIEPVTEIGYAQVTRTVGDLSASAQLTVVAGGVRYLDYKVTETVGPVTAKVTVVGFADNGTDRTEFNLSLDLARIAGTDIATLKHTIKVPTQGFQFSTSITYRSTDDSTTTSVDLQARGRNGRINIAGTVGNENQGSLEVKVNGELFATVTFEEGSPTFTGADDAPLTEEQEESLVNVFESFGDGFNILFSLAGPTGVGMIMG